MNNLLPYCGLVDAKIKASDKDLPVHFKMHYGNTGYAVLSTGIQN